MGELCQISCFAPQGATACSLGREPQVGDLERSLSPARGDGSLSRSVDLPSPLRGFWRRGRRLTWGSRPRLHAWAPSEPSHRPCRRQADPAGAAKARTPRRTSPHGLEATPSLSSPGAPRASSRAARRGSTRHLLARPRTERRNRKGWPEYPGSKAGRDTGAPARRATARRGRTPPRVGRGRRGPSARAGARPAAPRA